MWESRPPIDHPEQDSVTALAPLASGRSAARPPRTSSLLPPPRIGPSASTAPYQHALQAVVDATSQVPPRSSHARDPSPRQQAVANSKPTAGASFHHASASNHSFLHLNRTSSSTSSTVSTRASLLPPQHASTSDRDTSADGPTIVSQSPPSLTPSPQQSRLKRRSSSAMPYENDRERYQPRGHSRGRSSKGSSDLGKTRAVKPPSQKAMLSRALQKANTAVQLDNAQNFEGARVAYAEACELLAQVLQKTTGDEDKRKLEAIRRTYTSRIDELDQLGPWQEPPSKALPARPGSPSYNDEPTSRQQADVQKDPYASQQKSSNGATAEADNPYSTSRVPYQQQEPGLLQSSFSKPRRPTGDSHTGPTEASSSYVLPPIAAQNSMSPAPNARHQDSFDGTGRLDFGISSIGTMARGSQGHTRSRSANSWLDPANDNAPSRGSSVHSRTSSQGYRRRHLRPPSGNTESEFDTALDAAIEAAYDEGYEPMDADDINRRRPSEEEIVAQALRKVEIARERVRQTEREAHEMANEQARVRQLRLQQERQHQHIRHNTSEGFYDDDDSSEEEERLLEEMTRDLAIEEFTLQQHQNLPKKGTVNTTSPSSGTRQGPGRPPNTSAPPPKPLLMINDGRSLPPNISRNMQPSMPPPTTSLPEIPTQHTSSNTISPPQTVQNRRLSAQKRKELKIETAKLAPSTSGYSEVASKPKSTARTEQKRDVSTEEAEEPVSAARWQSPPIMEPSPSEPRSYGSPLRQDAQVDGDDAAAGRSGSPSMHKLRKNFSSSSLRSMKSRNLSISNVDEHSDMSPGTPSSHNFTGARAPAMPAMPTPLAAVFREHAEVPSGGMYLFDDTVHLANTPGSPNPSSLDPPVQLEPCPTDFMLRPFWLMRCLFQTLVHPRGGYLSTKLFVPRDVWRVKGVKLRSVEDKISNCDYLTAALLKLARVDTYDADAVLEEMQSLEGVLEQVQAGLSRKLGNEVGVQSSGILFKEASPSVEGEAAPGMPRSASVSNKSSSFSWRRLRSKNSAVGMSGAYNSRGGVDGSRDIGSLPTLPMTPTPTTRPAKRDIATAAFTGPNANYMGSLARLFDAAQAIDQIARQVDDPGLRHADKTQVGLELCTRHAAEFFGFFICRFVMTDLGLLLDKFIKRGSEWVLA